jgi:hypothetical protein
MTTSTHDLGHGWKATIFEATTYRTHALITLRHDESGRIIDLNAYSLESLTGGLIREEASDR